MIYRNVKLTDIHSPIPYVTIIKRMCLEMVDNMSIEDLKKLFNVEVIDPFKRNPLCISDNYRTYDPIVYERDDPEAELLRKHENIQFEAHIKV